MRGARRGHPFETPSRIRMRIRERLLGNTNGATSFLASLRSALDRLTPSHRLITDLPYKKRVYLRGRKSNELEVK